MLSCVRIDNFKRTRRNEKYFFYKVSLFSWFVIKISIICPTSDECSATKRTITLSSNCVFLTWISTLWTTFQVGNFYGISNCNKEHWVAMPLLDYTNYYDKYIRKYYIFYLKYLNIFLIKCKFKITFFNLRMAW